MLYTYILFIIIRAHRAHECDIGRFFFLYAHRDKDTDVSMRIWPQVTDINHINVY